MSQLILQAIAVTLRKKNTTLGMTGWKELSTENYARLKFSHSSITKRQMKKKFSKKMKLIIFLGFLETIR